MLPQVVALYGKRTDVKFAAMMGFLTSIFVTFIPASSQLNAN
jgi:hypothetical protein